MTELNDKHPNLGPLKLDHDITPRDYGAYNSQVNGTNGEESFRFQGYPGGNMERAREKNTTRASIETEMPTRRSQEKYYGLPNHFDTNRPKVFDKPEGLAYGSDGMPLTRPGPRPIRDPMHERTSAEIQKYRHLQDEIEIEIGVHKEEKKQKMLAREEEKKQDMQQLKEYHPWGRPGGGAPTNDPKKKVFTEQETEKVKPSPRQSEDFLQEYGDFHAQFGRPGAGAPLKTESGHVKAEVKADPSIRFQDTKQGRHMFDQDVRYRKAGEEKMRYSQELEQQIEQKNFTSQERKLLELQKEMEMIKHDPYGRPGAGAPNKTASDFQRNGKPSDYEFYDPWGKGAGHPIRDEYGDVRRFKQANKERGIITEVSPRKQDMFDDPDGKSIEFTSQGGAGAPVYTSSGNVKTRMPITMKRDDKGDSSVRENSHRKPLSDDPEIQIYDPWGKSGGGAPMKDRQGNVQASVFGKMKNETGSATNHNKSVDSRNGYLEELQRDMETQRHNRYEQERNLKYGGGEFAAVIKAGQVGRGPRRDPNTGQLLDQHLPASDVTKLQTDQRQYKNENSLSYHTELEHAAEERQRMSKLDRLRDQQESNQHQKISTNYWGKPGGGAPNTTAKMSNLEDILYSPRKELNDFYSKQNPTGGVPYNYVRSTVDSTHVNQYEFDTPHKPTPKKDYQLLTPFAIAKEESVFS